MSPPRARLADLVRPGMRIALSDGLGSPRCVSAELSAAAAAAGEVRLLLGWTPALDPALDLLAFADVRTLMSGWGLRSAVDAGLVHALPVRLGAIPALLHGPLRPDLLVAGVVARSGGGFGFGTEVAWMRAAVDAGARVAAVVGSRTPSSDAGPALPDDRVVVVGESDDPPATLAFTPPAAVHRAIAEHIAALIPSGARLQVGPGALGTAVVDELRTPVRVDSGLLPDGIPLLERRGLLLGEPVGTYLAGGPELLEWADGRPLLHRLEHTHDLTRLSTGLPFFAVNTALEVDEQGQVNVEGLHEKGRAASAVGGIGGHPDYAVAAARSAGGLSIVALPARHAGSATLVSRLSWPVTTPSHDVDVLVTEAGAVDLRGLDRSERARAVAGLWEAEPVTAGSEG
ncbi:MAG: putative acetyl-CoA hydrolase/transferase [Frankiales bacterium]|nr:putative acetyl-CoA hydrolase/transferase [Frankiales bacterium]